AGVVGGHVVYGPDGEGPGGGQLPEPVERDRGGDGEHQRAVRPGGDRRGRQAVVGEAPEQDRAGLVEHGGGGLPGGGARPQGGGRRSGRPGGVVRAVPPGQQAGDERDDEHHGQYGGPGADRAAATYPADAAVDLVAPVGLGRRGGGVLAQDFAEFRSGD